MRLLWVFARAYPWRGLLMLICLLLGGLAEGVGLSTLLPFISMAASGSAGGASTPARDSELGARLVEIMQSLGLQPTIGVLLLIVAGGMFVKAGLVLLANRQVGYTVAHVATDLRLSLIRALLRTRWQYYVRQPIGSFANAIASEASRASQAYLHGTLILSLLIQGMVYGAVAFLVSWRAAALALLAGTVIVYALNRLVRMSRRAGVRQTRLSKSLLGQLTDTMQGIKPLKAMAREALIGPLLEAETERLNRALQRQVLAREALRALQEPLIVAFLALGLYVTTARWQLPLAAVIVLALLCARMLASLSQVQREVQRMVTCESAFWSLRQMIDEAEGEREVSTGKQTPMLRRGVTLERVSFAYDDAWVLREASLELAAGTVTVLVGPSGAGKSTVVDLVIGLSEPQSGAVLVDGVSLRDLDARLWRSAIGYVPQETFLLHQSILLNVTVGDPDLGPADVEAALRAAGAWEFVESLPEGMETIAGERGLRISGGQRQRIALARALVRKPKLLVLDEATTALDPATEAAICATLQRLRGEMTILSVSHQGAMVDVADRVYRVEGRSIAKVSRPETLAGRKLPRESVASGETDGGDDKADGLRPATSRRGG